MLVLQITTAVGLSTLLGGGSNLLKATSSKPDKSCTPESLVGRYDIVDGEKEGQGTCGANQGNDSHVHKGQIVVADKEKKEIYASFYKLDSTTNPCSITMTSRVESSAGEIARGLIQKDGDTVRLIYALPTGEIPAGFKTKEKQLMFVMKKTE